MTFESIIHAADRRRFRRFVEVGLSALCARRGSLAYTHVSWSLFAGLLYLLSDAERVGWMLIPTFALLLLIAPIILFDALYFLIPDRLLLLASIVGSLTILGYDASAFPGRLAAAASGIIVLRAGSWAYLRLRGHGGLGRGDEKLFGVAGLWLGFDGLPSCLIIAVVSALVSTAILFLGGVLRGSRDPIPFGPHLALGLWLVWTVGPFEGN